MSDTTPANAENLPVNIPFQQLERMAVAIAKSGLFGMKTPDQALTLMLIAQAEGMHPMIAARDYDIIQGKPAKKAEAMLKSFQMSGGKVEWHELSDTAADATFSHPQGGSVRIKWDMQRAAAAQLAGKEMWKKYPRQMLRSRCVSEGVRTCYPMATGGMYVPEEIRDQKPDRAPPKEVVAEVAPAQPQAPTEWAPSVDDLNELLRTGQLKGWSKFQVIDTSKRSYGGKSPGQLSRGEFADLMGCVSSYTFDEAKAMFEVWEKNNAAPSEPVRQAEPSEDDAPMFVG